LPGRMMSGSCSASLTTVDGGSSVEFEMSETYQRRRIREKLIIKRIGAKLAEEAYYDSGTDCAKMLRQA
jgi:hypothetical protein